MVSFFKVNFPNFINFYAILHKNGFNQNIVSYFLFKLTFIIQKILLTRRVYHPGNLLIKIILSQVLVG